MLTRVLRPGGVLRLVYAGPSPDGARDAGQSVAANLERHGFTTDLTLSPMTQDMVCVTGLRRLTTILT